jgi:diguanylate cyclase (GGDEF)-like protein/PAS domain S-box-containing protein
MHHLLKRQLKKTGAKVDEAFLKLVNQAYRDADEDRNLLEHSLDISSQEMKELYEKLKQKSKEKLRRSQERYNKLVYALRKYYFFYAHDVNGNFIYISDSIKQILGYSSNEFSTHYSVHMTDEAINENVKEKTQKAISGEQQEPYIVSIYHKNGGIRYLEVSEFPVFDANGEVIEVEGIARDVTTQHLDKEKLHYLSYHDDLTGISNRISLYHKLEYIIANSRRNNEHIAILFLDLDYFKEINDNLGHDIGDILLKETVNRIQVHIRESDLFARIGGDEFVIALTNINEAYISKIASKIVTIIQEPFTIKEHTINISTSIGISLFPQDAKDIDGLIKAADSAMYLTKQGGRNGFNYFKGVFKEQ